jgi:hypothetical protein
VSRHAFEYTVLRAVPRVDRGEYVNVGVVLYCQALDFLSARCHVNPGRLQALDPAVDLAGLEATLTAVGAACSGEPSAGPIAAEPPGVRFRWLTAPRSTVVQPGPVHAGVTDDPGRQLEHLFLRLVQ